MALGPIERKEVERHILEVDRLLKEWEKIQTWTQRGIHNVFENILGAIRRIAGAME